VRKAYKILVGKPEGKRPLVRPRRRRKNNINMYYKETRVGVCTRFTILRIKSLADTCEQGNNNSDFKKGGEPFST
jgi:hypothetical protein